MPAFVRAFYVFVCLLIFLIPKNVLSFFNEDFNGISLDSNIWQEYSNSGQVIVGDGKVTLLRSAIESVTFPYVFTKSNIFPEFGPFSIEIRYRYLSAGNFGDGIILSSESVPMNGVDSGTNPPAFITFIIWQDQPTGLSFQKLLCNLDGAECNDLKHLRPFTRVPDFNTQDIRIDYSDHGQYLVYLNGDISPIYISDFNQKRPKKLWFGNSHETGTKDFWSSFEIDYIHVVPINSNYPTILIPGLGASWDLGAILSGTDGSSWQIPSFVNNYEGLKSSFINVGYSYTDGRKLLTFAYDWRKPLDLLADQLDTYIEANIPPGEKVDLVGHSMGGLVARAYAQKHGVTRINKIAAIGSPNLGSVEAYSVWEGASLCNDIWWTKLALELTTHFGANPGETKVQTVQRVVPSIKDLLPTTTFLYKNDSLIPWSDMNQKNTYLVNLNQDISLINPLLKVFYSKDIQTKSTVNVISPSAEDLAEGIWVDGKPTDNPFSFVDGDGTVTESSSNGSFTNTVQGSGWHGELVTKEDNLKKVFDFLGLDQTSVIAGSYDSRKDVLVAALRSPGKIEVCNFEMTLCNEDIGIFLPDNDLFILPGYSNEKLILKVIEDGVGEYAVHLGDISDDADWKILNGNLQSDGQVDYYNIGRDGQNITFEVDKTGPSVPQITGFHNPELVCGDTTNQHYATVDWNDSNDTNGVSKYLYNVDYPLNGNRGQWNTSFKVSQFRGSLSEGVHYIKVRAEDRFGNLSDWSNTCSITADWSAPKVIITSPVTGTYNFRDLPKLKYLATDNLDTNLEITSTGLPKSEGTHTVTVTAKDDAGNTGSSSVTYTIKKDHLRDVCKKNGWKLFGLFRYRNQGECEKYFDRVEKVYELTHKYFNVWGWR